MSGAFNYQDYPDAPAFVVYVNGTGHDQGCTTIDKGTIVPDMLVPFAAGGFDLFCSCADGWIPDVDASDTVATEFLKNAPGAPTSTPVAPMPEGETYTAEMVAELIGKLGRKFDISDMDKGLVSFATEWAKSYSGTFSFMVDMQIAASGRRGLSAGQAKGTLNCYRAELNRKAPVQKGSGSEELDLSEIPAGIYGVPGSEGRLKVRIAKPGGRSKWEGWIFVSDGAEYGSEKRYGKQAPGSIYVGEIQDQLKKILEDPMEATAQYGRLTGTCGICSRHLEDADSIARGIGPVCAQKFGG
jgi:hypothetical protein